MMEELWKVAIGLTGISGVASFVLYSLYKDWLHAPVLLGLTKEHKFKLLRLFLILTFIFAIVTIALAGYEKWLNSTKEKYSWLELHEILSSRYKTGLEKLAEIIAKPDLDEADKKKIKKIYDKYALLTKDAQKAYEENNYVVWHEKNNQIQSLLRSSDAKEYLDESDVKEMASDPNLEQKFQQKSEPPTIEGPRREIRALNQKTGLTVACT